MIAEITPPEDKSGDDAVETLEGLADELRRAGIATGPRDIGVARPHGMTVHLEREDQLEASTLAEAYGCDLEVIQP